MCSKLPATFTPFPVLSLWVCPRTIKVSLPPLYLQQFSHGKNTRLSPPAQLQCLYSGVWEPGNEATKKIHTWDGYWWQSSVNTCVSVCFVRWGHGYPCLCSRSGCCMDQLPKGVYLTGDGIHASLLSEVRNMKRVERVCKGENGMGGWRWYVQVGRRIVMWSTSCALHLNNQTFMMVLTNIEIVRSIFPTVAFLCSGSPV